MGRPCEAMIPLETYVSFDPVSRRSTGQIKTILDGLASKGGCAGKLATGSADIRFSSEAKSIYVDAMVNGARGRFIVDTGATTVLVDRSFASKAGIKTTSSSAQ
jgi:predicted aspartyl protease